ncbi:MAG: phospholipase D-like domain-containing protein, partial [Bacteroidia bacterium]
MKRFYNFLLVLIFVSCLSQAQNPYIKCYFNHPVNTTVSSGVNAHYNTSFKDTLIGYINRAKYSIDFCVYDYLHSTGDGFDAIATAVNSAYARGVVIRWIYNGSSTNSGLSLLNSNIKTIGSPTTSAYGICHNKFAVFDANSSNPADAFVWTGSFNFSLAQNSSDYNNIIIIQNKPLAQAYYAQFNQMWGGTGSAPNLTNSKFGTFKSPSATTSFTVGGTPVEVYFSPKDNATTQMQNYVSTANFELHFGIYTFTDNNIATAIKNRILAGVSSKGIEDQFSQSYSPYSTLSPTMGSNFKVYT